MWDMCFSMLLRCARQALQGIYTGIGGHLQRPAKRTYHIQAEEVMWDYAPHSKEGNLCGPSPRPFNTIEVRRCLFLRRTPAGHALHPSDNDAAVGCIPELEACGSEPLT